MIHSNKSSTSFIFHLAREKNLPHEM